MSTTAFYVDNSTLSTFANCSFKAWLRYLQHLTTKEERAELLSGTAGHEALAYHYRGRSINDSLSEFSLQYQSWAVANVMAGERLAWSNVYPILTYWIQTHQVEKLPYRVDPSLVEVPFEVALDEHGDYILIGRIDLIPTMGNAYYILDHKFTGKVSGYWSGQFRMGSQPSSYCYGARHGLVNGKPLNLPVAGALINAIELSRVPTDDKRKCKTHGMSYSECGVYHPNHQLLGPFPRDEHMLEQWRADALMLAKKLKQLKEQVPNLEMAHLVAQEGAFTGHCRFCEAENTCLTGRDPVLMQANLVRSVWDPRERTEVRK